MGSDFQSTANDSWMNGTRENEQVLRALISSSFDAIIAIDQKRKIISFNRQAEVLLGYLESEILGESVEVIHKDERRIQEIYRTIKDHGEIKCDDIFLVHKDGRKIPISLFGKRICDDNAKILGYVEFIRDLRLIHSIENRLGTLFAALRTLNSTNDIQEILVSLIRHTLHAIPSADGASIHRYDPKTRNLSLFVSSYDYSRRSWGEHSFEVGEGIAGWVFEHQQAINCEDTKADLRYKSVRNREVKRHSSILCAPVTGNQQIGVISLSQSRNMRAFSDADLELLIAFANLTAIAIERAEQIKHSREIVDELETLRRTSLNLNTLIHIEDILKNILFSGNKLLGSEMAVVHWRGRSGEKFETFTVPEELEVLKTNPRQEGGLTAEILLSGKPIVVPDTSLDDRVNPEVRTVGIQSLIGYPLQSGGRIAGVLFFNSRKRQFFGDHEIQLISSLLPAAAVAIENADIIERLKRARYLSESLVQVTNKLATTQVPEEQLQALKYFMQRELAAPMFYLGLYDPINEVIQLKIHFEDGTDQGSREIQMTGRKEESISTFIVKTGRPIVWFSELEKREKCKLLGIDPIRIGQSCQTCLAFPLLVEKKVIGILSIQSPEPNAWNEIEVSAFQTLCHQASIAIQNAQLIQEINSALDTLQSNYQASEKIISELNPDKALDNLVDSICREFGAFRACAILIDQDGKPYHLSASSGFDKNYGLASAFREGGISLNVHKKSRPDFVEELLDRAHEVHPKMLEQGVRAAAILPLTYQGDRLGVLWLHYERPRRFTEDDKKAISLFTNQASIAYVNAKLHQQNKRAHDTAMLVEQMIALGDLSKTLDTIVRGIKDVLGCNLVILYTYQQEKNEFSSPTIAGNLRFPEKIAGPVQPNAVPYRIIELDDIYVFKYSQHDLILGSPFAIRENVQSGVAVPLKLNDTKVGVLFINYVGQKHTITPEDLQYIRHFASQAVVAIHNAILYEDVKKRREVLKIIDEAGRTVTSSLHLNKIFKNLAQQAYKLTGLVGKSATLSSISLVEGSHIVLQAVYPPNEKRKILDANADRVDLEKGVDGRIGIIGKAVKEQVSVLVRDVRGNPDYITSHSDTKSELAVPIIYGEKVIGAINLEHDEIAGLDEDDQQNIHALAAHAAVAIQNAHMYRSLERKSHHQGAIYEASKIINASLERTEKQLFDLLAEQMVTEIVPAAEAKNLLGAILIYDSEKKQLELASTYPDGVFGEHVVGEVRSLIQPSSKIGITGQAVLEKRVQRIEDVRKCDSYLNYHPETKSELDVPIMDGEAVLGVLSLESDQFNGFDRDAEDALRAFAELAAIAIQNTRRYQELRDAKAKIGNITAVAWMGLVAAAWRHAIGNKATTIFDTTRLIQKDLEKGASDKHINQRLEKIQSLIAEIRQIPMPPLGNEEGQEDVLIFDLVFDRIKQFENKGRYGDIEYEMKIGVHKLEKVHCSPEWLRRILDILIDNAKEAMKESEVKKMIFTLKYENDGVVILVSDIGRGIPDYQRGNLMNQPIEKKPGEKGAGIGLFLANTVVQTYNGRLEIRSTGPEGTTMAIWLPLLR